MTSVAVPEAERIQMVTRKEQQRIIDLKLRRDRDEAPPAGRRHAGCHLWICL
jgi:hypothetical protein